MDGRPRRTRPPGFTVVEMMIVLGMIGVLLALAIPAYIHLEARAKQTQCCSNLHQIFVALSNYATANNGLIPTNIPGGEEYIPYPAGLSTPMGPPNADVTTNEIGTIGKDPAGRLLSPPRVPSGLGKLHGELGDNLGVLFCPTDGRRNAAAERTAFLNDRMLDNGDSPSSSYLFRGRFAPEMRDPSDPDYLNMLTASRRFGAQGDTVRALAMDYYFVGMSRPHHGDRLCVLFEDGTTLVVAVSRGSAVDRFVDPLTGPAAYLDIWRRADRLYQNDD